MYQISINVSDSNDAIKNKCAKYEIINWFYIINLPKLIQCKWNFIGKD